MALEDMSLLDLCEVLCEGVSTNKLPEVITIEDIVVAPPTSVVKPTPITECKLESQSAWGNVDYKKLDVHEDDDKEALHKMLGIKNKVRTALNEFIIPATVKRKRGRPPKRPILDMNASMVTKSEDSQWKENTSKMKKTITKEEVQAYLHNLKLQVAEESNNQIKRKVGRPKKLKSSLEEDVKKEPRKRGRPRDPNKPVKIIPEVKRKRGRPPKPRTLEDLVPKEPKRRGRPPKPKTAEDLLPKIPKKRGRPCKMVALEDLGVQVIYGDNNDSPSLLAGKSSISYGRNLSDSNEVHQNEILDMISSGLLEVDVTDTGKSLPKRRGRPPFDPNRPQSTPKIPEPPHLSEKGKILGRPRKGTVRPIEEPKEKKSRGRPKKPIIETENREPKKRGRPKKLLLDDSLKATSQHIHNIKVMKQWTTKYRSKSYVPSYKARQIYNCCWCRQWSWDIKICSHCCRSVPAECQLLSIEEHEVIDDNTDTTRPYFHPPPLPYIRPGYVVLCTGCFYYTPVSDSNCMECGLDIPRNATLLHVEFSADVAPPNSKEIPYTPRLVEDDWIECPHCGLSLSKQVDSCTHCRGLIPKNCFITVLQKSSDTQQWPSEEMLEEGVVQEPGLGYVPLFKEGRVAMCCWCCTYVWDFNRCNKCLRKLPPTTDLLLDGPCYDNVDGEEAKRPTYSSLPNPYLRPGIMAICGLCKNFSKNLKHCDGCKKRLNDSELVDVSFEDPSEVPGERETILPYVTRTVNFVYAVCPHCEFSTPDFETCVNCGKKIPSYVVVRPASDVMYKKPKPDAPAVLTFKPRSIFYAEETLGGTYQPVQNGIKHKRSSTYIPRYREHGIAQCGNCLMWTWDFNQCSNCFAPVQNHSALPPVIYNTIGFKDKQAIKESRPKFAPPPTPYLRPGRVVFCKSCFSCTAGPPICIICDKEFDDNPLFFFVNFKWIPTSTTPLNSYVAQFQPRTTANGNLCLCPFCGFTTENFEKCSYCDLNIPKICLVTAKTFDELKPLLDVIKKNEIESDKDASLQGVPIIDTHMVETQGAQENVHNIKECQISEEKEMAVIKTVVDTPTPNPSKNSVKVVALKPVPPPKILPKNIIKINTNSPLNVHKRIPTSLVPLTLQGPVCTNLIKFPTFEPPTKHLKTSGFLDKIMLASANSKLQAGLVSAGLISSPKTPNSTVSNVSLMESDISAITNVQEDN